MVTRLQRLENEWNELDMERDHITETMQSIKKEILELQNKKKPQGVKDGE
jgi:prefoldin subunit 5